MTGNGPLPRKMPRQKGIGSRRYHFHSFYRVNKIHDETPLQQRRSIVTAAKNAVHDNRHRIRIFFSIDVDENHIFNIYLIIINLHRDNRNLYRNTYIGRNHGILRYLISTVQ